MAVVDVNAKVRSHLAANGTLVADVSTRIYPGRENPPQGYNPSDGGCVCFAVRGGDMQYEDAHVRPSVQFTVWNSSPLTAWSSYRKLFDALHEQHTEHVLYGYQDQMGQSLRDPETDWPFVLTAFQLVIRNA